MVGPRHAAGPGSRPRRFENPIRSHPWVAGALALISVAFLFVLITGMRPAYDAYGWLVWGREAAHLNLDTNAAPSWKPLTFLFTLTYAAAGGGALWLWMITAVAGSLAGGVFAARIAYKLTPARAGRGYARYVAAVFAALGIFGIEGFWHFALIATADPLLVTLCLAAIDSQLSGRPGWTWALLILASLGRPETWVPATLYALWAWRAMPAMRSRLVVGALAVPLLWFGIPAITSRTWLIASEVDRSSGVPLTGNRIMAVLHGLVSLYELPMQIAALCVIALTVVRRDSRTLILIAAAAAWVATEMFLALRGWPVAPRYVFEPAAVMVLLVGAGVGTVLAVTPTTVLLRLGALGAVVALVATLAPQARIRARLFHNGVVLGQNWALQIHRLHQVIAREGGPERVLACGTAVTEVPYQSILAWEIGQNVADVGYDPRAWALQGEPMVLFEPYQAGWQVRALNTRPSQRTACAGLQTDTPWKTARRNPGA
jgi:hypothetical protein